MRAPPESLIPINGQPTRAARSIILQIFSPITSPSEPPKTVKSWLKTQTWRPSIVPCPVIDRVRERPACAPSRSRSCGGGRSDRAPGRSRGRAASRCARAPCTSPSRAASRRPGPRRAPPRAAAPRAARASRRSCGALGSPSTMIVDCGTAPCARGDGALTRVRLRLGRALLSLGCSGRTLRPSRRRSRRPWRGLGRLRGSRAAVGLAGADLAQRVEAALGRGFVARGLHER